MGWKNWLNWKSGMVYFLIISLYYIIYSFKDSRFGILVAFQVSFTVGILFFIFGGIIGKFLWKERWFRYISMGILISSCIFAFGSPSYVRMTNVYLTISIIPLILILLLFFKDTPYWMKGLSIWLNIPFWIFFVLFIISMNNAESPLGLFVIIMWIPIIIISSLIGIILGVLKEKRLKRG